MRAPQTYGKMAVVLSVMCTRFPKIGEIVSEYLYDQPTYEAPVDDCCCCAPAPVEEVPIVAEPVVAEPVLEAPPVAEPIPAQPAVVDPAPAATQSAPSPVADTPSAPTRQSSTGAWTVFSADPGSENLAQSSVPNEAKGLPGLNVQPVLEQAAPVNFVFESPDAEPSPGSIGETVVLPNTGHLVTTGTLGPFSSAPGSLDPFAAEHARSDRMANLYLDAQRDGYWDDRIRYRPDGTPL